MLTGSLTEASVCSAEWKEKRRQLRTHDFRYNVLDELAAYQRFEAEHAVLLVLRSISEHDIMHLFQLAHQRLRVSTTAVVSSASPLLLEMPPVLTLVSPSSPKRSLTPTAPMGNPRNGTRYDGPRRSTLIMIPPHAKAMESGPE
jgi:hypothetical protein